MSLAEPDPGALARTYGVRLLYPQAPSLSKAVLLPLFRERCGAVAAVDPTGETQGLSFHFPAHRVPFKGQSLPAQCWVLVADQAMDPAEVEETLRQTWTWPGAREAVARHRAGVIVTDLMAAGLDWRERLELFQNSLLAVLKAAPPLAIHWMRAGKFVDPEAYRRSHEPGAGVDPLFGPLNVRAFDIPDAPGATLMDTLGLGALGLPDLQIVFKGLRRGEVAGLLTAAAGYIYQKGPVVQTGHSIRGLNASDRWLCTLRMSSMPPAREVISIDPGEAGR